MDTPCKLIVITAPSGSGKTTIVRHLLATFDTLEFSVSATSRSKRPGEEEGKAYYFLTVDEFKKKIADQAFIEYQEVYENQYYGTLKSEIDRLGAHGKNILFDIDVKGAVNIKKLYGDHCLTVFIKPPSIEELARRLMKRSTETPESLKKRIDKATLEMEYADRFDRIIVNDILENSLQEAENVVTSFLNCN